MKKLSIFFFFLIVINLINSTRFPIFEAATSLQNSEENNENAKENANNETETNDVIEEELNEEISKQNYYELYIAEKIINLVLDITENCTNKEFDIENCKIIANESFIAFYNSIEGLNNNNLLHSLINEFYKDYSSYHAQYTLSKSLINILPKNISIPDEIDDEEKKKYSTNVNANNSISNPHLHCKKLENFNDFKSYDYYHFNFQKCVQCNWIVICGGGRRRKRVFSTNGPNHRRAYGLYKKKRRNNMRNLLEPLVEIGTICEYVLSFFGFDTDDC